MSDKPHHRKPAAFKLDDPRVIANPWTPGVWDRPNVDLVVVILVILLLLGRI